MRFALLAATMTALSGCMSSPADQLASVQTLPVKQQQQRSTALQKTDRVAGQDNLADDQSSIAVQASEDVNSLNEQTLAANERQQPVSDTSNSLVARRNIAATQNSIFASPDTSTVDNGGQLNANTNSLQPGDAMNAAQNSIYASQPDQQARDTTTIPLPDAGKAAEAQDLAMAGMEVPPDLQVASADPAAADQSTALAAEQNASQQTNDMAAKTRGLDQDVPDYQTALSNVDQRSVAEPKKKRLTLADFFRKKNTETAEFDGERFGKRKTLNTSAIPNMKTASLSDQALPGVNTNAMMPVPDAMSDDETSEGDDQPAGLMKLASLPGMTRMAPNGLWTQTDQVEVRCLRPQLVGMLKEVESHYGRPVIVTSGFRDVGHNRRVGGVRHSLHTLCAAADIQVEGVSKWQLADYLRSIPGRGGVGTYCHTNSVHIDIGSERDWNWRCRRRSRRG